MLRAQQHRSDLVLLVALTSCLLAVSGCGEPASESNFSTTSPSLTASGAPGDASDFRSAVVELADNGAIPGLAYAIVSSDGIVDSDGYGLADIENGVEAGADTLFHIGSTHKAMTAFLVATLVDDEILDWDTSVAAIAGDFDLDPAITVRHLLTMTSGIPDDAEDELPSSETRQELLDDAIFVSIEEALLLGTPGSVFEYSNVSASAAGYAAALAESPDEADVHGHYLQLFEERVLDPLGMSDSLLLASDARASGRLAASYALDGDEAIRLESEDTDNDLVAPSGSLKSSANDMGLFLQVLLAGGTTADGRQIVSPASIDTMWEPAFENYAMGWEAGTDGGVDYLFHEGSFDGFASIILVIPDEDLALVLLTNSEDAAADLIAGVPRLFIDTQA